MNLIWIVFQTRRLDPNFNELQLGLMASPGCSVSISFRRTISGLISGASWAETGLQLWEKNSTWFYLNLGCSDDRTFMLSSFFQIIHIYRNHFQKRLTEYNGLVENISRSDTKFICVLIFYLQLAEFSMKGWAVVPVKIKKISTDEKFYDDRLKSMPNV